MNIGTWLRRCSLSLLRLGLRPPPPPRTARARAIRYMVIGLLSGLYVPLGNWLFEQYVRPGATPETMVMWMMLGACPLPFVVFGFFAPIVVLPQMLYWKQLHIQTRLGQTAASYCVLWLFALCAALISMRR